MRFRGTKIAPEKIQEHAGKSLVAFTPGQTPLQWSDIFDQDALLYVEIGCGKGRFIVEHARRNPHINYVAIEKFSTLLYRTLCEWEENPLPNLRFMSADAQHLPEIFALQKIDRIYLNFSDPWPKKRNQKRRLTSPNFIDRYRQVLQAGGEVIVKTDNPRLFEYSLLTLSTPPCRLQEVILDLHRRDWEEQDEKRIMTEYEIKFHDRGKPVYYLAATLQEKN